MTDMAIIIHFAVCMREIKNVEEGEVRKIEMHVLKMQI